MFLRRDRSIQQFFLAGRQLTIRDLQAVYDVLSAPPASDSVDETGKGWTVENIQLKAGMGKGKTVAALGLLREQSIVSKTASNVWRSLQTDVDAATLQALVEAHLAQRAHEREKLERMVAYAETGMCRWKMLLDYLQTDAAVDLPGDRCTTCDNCRRIAEVEAALSPQPELQLAA